MTTTVETIRNDVGCTTHPVETETGGRGVCPFDCRGVCPFDCGGTARRVRLTLDAQDAGEVADICEVLNAATKHAGQHWSDRYRTGQAVATRCECCGARLNESDGLAYLCPMCHGAVDITELLGMEGGDASVPGV